MPKTAQELYTESRQFFIDADKALNGICESLPDDVKTALKPLRDQINEQLSGMKPLDQIEAAQQANYALNSMGFAMARIQDANKELMAMLAKLSGQVSGHAAALNGKISEALEKEVTEGRFVKKEAHEQALKDQKAGFELREKRTADLAKNGLPLPIVLDDLGLPEDKWTVKVAAAKDRVTKLKEKAHSLNGDKLARVLFGDQEIFDTLLENLPKAGPAKRTNTADPAITPGSGDGTPSEYKGAC